MSRSTHTLAVSLMSLCVVLLIMSGCSKEKPTEPREPETIIADNVKVLEDNGSVALDSTDGVTYYFSFSDNAPNLQQGDIMVGAENSGFLREVTAVSLQGNLLQVSTTDAALTDAFVKCSLQTTLPLRLNDAMNKTVTQSGKLAYLAKGVSISENGIDLSGVTLFSDENNSISISSGYVNFAPDLDLGFKIEDRSVKEFHAIGTGELTSSLNVSASCSMIGRSGETVLASIPVGTAVVWIGFVPVVISSTLSFSAGYLFEASEVELNTGYESCISVSCGARYENSDWTTIWDKNVSCTAHETEWSDPRDLQLKVFVRPEIAVEIYAISGPNLGIDAYVKYYGQVDEAQWLWDLTGGIEGNLGFRVHFLSWELVDYNVVLAQWETKLASDTGSITGGPIILEQDFTGDGTLDIRADNGLMWIQVNRDEVEQAGKFIDAGGISGEENLLRTFIQAGGLVDQVAYWSTENFEITVLENSMEVGTYKVSAVDTANGKEVTKEFTVRLEAGQEYVWISYVFTNTGDAAWSYDHPLSHVHDGTALANVTFSELYDIDAYINGVGRIDLPTIGLWQSYAPDAAAPFAVLFKPSSGEAVTYGFQGAAEYPLNQIVAYYTGAAPDITPTLDFQASEFTLNPGASTEWKAIVAFHSGGDAKGIEIYTAATW